MKKSILLSALFLLTIITVSIFSSDGPTYLVTSLIALTVIGIIQFNPSGVMKLTRWAKANPKKTQWLICGLQIVIMGLGIISGKNLRELGYLFSDTTAWFFGAITVICFLSVPFWWKKNTIAIPTVVAKQRLAYIGISISSLILMAQVGNRIEDIYPNSPVAQAVEKIDQSIFSDNIINYLGSIHDSRGQVDQIHTVQASIIGSAHFAVFTVDPGMGIKTIDQIIVPDNSAPSTILNKEPLTKKEIRKTNKEIRKNYRKSAAVMSSGAATALTILLVILVCVGACLFFGGIGAVISGDLIGIAGIIIGPLLVWAAVDGIKKLSKKNRVPTAPTT